MTRLRDYLPVFLARLQELFEAVIHSEDEKNLAYFPADDNDLPQRVEVINVEWLGVCPDAAGARHGDTLGGKFTSNIHPRHL